MTSKPEIVDNANLVLQFIYFLDRIEWN